MSIYLIVRKFPPNIIPGFIRIERCWPTSPLTGLTATGRVTSSGQVTALRREAPPVDEDKAFARESSSGQDTRNNREIGHFRTASISQATLRRTETSELTGKTD